MKTSCFCLMNGHDRYENVRRLRRNGFCSDTVNIKYFVRDNIINTTDFDVVAASFTKFKLKC